MSVFTPTQLYKGTLTSTLTTNLYTAPAKIIIKEMVLCNPHTAVVNVTISAGVAASEKKIFDAYPLQVGETKIISLSTVLNTNEVIDGGDSVGAVVDVIISGIVIT